MSIFEHYAACLLILVIGLFSGNTFVWAAEEGEVARGPFSRAIEAALANDPQYLSALASREATIEEKEKARAGLLPNATYNYSKANTTSAQSSASTSAGTVLPPVTYKYDAITKSLMIKQPLLRLRSWYAFWQTDANAVGADFQLASKLQQLYLRVSSALVDIGYAQLDIMRAEQAADAASWNYEQKRRLETAGEVIAADKLDALAQLKQSRSDVEETRRNLRIAQLSYEVITGGPGSFVLPAQLAALGLSLPLPPLQQLQEWQKADNPDLKFKREAVRAAEYEVRKNLSEHAPTIDLFAAKSLSESGQDVAVGRTIDTTQLGVQVTIPLYAGGGTQAAVRQARANLRVAEEDLRSLELSLGVELERSYYNAVTQAERLENLKAALDAGEVTYRTASEGFAAGARTRVDVVQAQARLSAVRRDLAKAASEYLKAYMQVWAGAGRLDPELIRRIEIALANT